MMFSVSVHVIVTVSVNLRGMFTGARAQNDDHHDTAADTRAGHVTEQTTSSIEESTAVSDNMENDETGDGFIGESVRNVMVDRPVRRRHVRERNWNQGGRDTWCSAQPITDQVNGSGYVRHCCGRIHNNFQNQ